MAGHHAAAAAQYVLLLAELAASGHESAGSPEIVMFVPSGFTHGILNLEDTVGVAVEVGEEPDEAAGAQ